MARWEHELTLAMEPGRANLAHADLQPAHADLPPAHADQPPAHAVDISDIAAAAEGGARSIGFVVREVHARMSDRLCRAVHIRGALSWPHPGKEGKITDHIQPLTAESMYPQHAC